MLLDAQRHVEVAVLLRDVRDVEQELGGSHRVGVGEAGGIEPQRVRVVGARNKCAATLERANAPDRQDHTAGLCRGDTRDEREQGEELQGLREASSLRIPPAKQPPPA